LPVPDCLGLYVPFVVKRRDRARGTRRSAAGLLALVENRQPLRRFSKLGGKAVGGSVLAVLRGRPRLFRGASASIGHRPRAPLWEEGGPGGGGNSSSHLCDGAPGCPTIDDRDLRRPGGRPGFDLTPPIMRPAPSGPQRLRARQDSCSRALNDADGRCSRPRCTRRPKLGPGCGSRSPFGERARP
jgi:hypothetical protein